MERRGHDRKPISPEGNPFLSFSILHTEKREEERERERESSFDLHPSREKERGERKERKE